MKNWKEYTGTDEQNAEMENSPNGWVCRFKHGDSDLRYDVGIQQYIHNINISELAEYWIIPDDPLREMKIRQAQTGQPVWIRKRSPIIEDKAGWIIGCTNTPNWNIPNAEYSFKPFEG